MPSKSASDVDTEEDDPYAAAPTEPGRRSQKRVWPARLVVFPPAEAAWAALVDHSVTVGRTDFVGRTVADRRMSRNHLTIRQSSETGMWHASDPGSRNGTCVDGVAGARHALRHSAVVRIGDTVVVFEIGPHHADVTDPHVSSIAARLEPLASAAAADERPVFLLGPTGSGKTFLAERIAAASRMPRPFVAVNCAALTPTLADSELFGYEAGAFTGAKVSKRGLVESADGGTLFLDEIGTLPTDVQAKLLTSLENGRVRRLGATAERTVRVRTIAATNLEIEAAVEDGRFREDLRYRLAGHVLTLRPLRERAVDIAALSSGHLGADDHRVFTPDALEAVLCFAWPGNIRELAHAMAAVRRRADRRVTLDDLPAPLRENIAALRDAGSMGERARPTPDALAQHLREAAGNVSEVARKLGVHRTQVHRWCRYYGVDPGAYRE